MSQQPVLQCDSPTGAVLACPPRSAPVRGCTRPARPPASWTCSAARSWASRFHGSDDAEHAAHLVKRTALAEGIHAMAAKPVLHGDNGATLKTTTVLAMLHWLGVKPSYSRPRVSGRQRLRRESVPRGQVPAGVPGQRLGRFRRGPHLGGALRALVQPRSSAQQHPLRQPGAATRRSRSRDPRRSSCAVRAGSRAQPASLVGHHARDWSAIDVVTLNPEREVAVPTSIAAGAIKQRLAA